MNKCNAKNYREVIENLYNWADSDDDSSQWSNHGLLSTAFMDFLRHVKEKDIPKYVPILNTVLDTILNNDGFGTEGQSDPRGDQRE